MKTYLWTLMLILAVPSVSAHGSADNHLQIMVIDDRIKMNIVVDMRVLTIADEDDDGFAGLEELADASQRIREWARQSFDVKDNRGSPGHVIFVDITSDLDIAHANGDRVDHARVLQTVAFPEPVRGLHVDLGKLASQIPELRVTVIDAASGLRYKLLDPRSAQTISLPTKPKSG